MKLKAFLQAFFIVIFLFVSWFLVVRKFNRTDEKSTNESDHNSNTMDVSDDVLPSPYENASTTLPSPASQTPPTSSEVPEGWEEWISFFDDQQSPSAMREGLQNLATSLLSLPREEAVQRILNFLTTGYDYKTGLAFQPGRNHTMHGLPTLRSFLIDLLHQIDPQTAFAFSKSQLESFSTRLPQGEFAINLRNVADFDQIPMQERVAFLKPLTLAMLKEPQYLNNPTSAFADAFDIIVFLQESDIAPTLASLITKDQSASVRKAANLSLDRLIIQNPKDTLAYLLNDLQNLNEFPNARAGYFARANPATAEGRATLDVYLNHPSVSDDEVHAFLERFPNLNLTFSNNLLTNNESPSAEDVQAHLQSSLGVVEEWLANPLYQKFYAEMLATRNRLAENITTP